MSQSAPRCLLHLHALCHTREMIQTFSLLLLKLGLLLTRQWPVAQITKISFLLAKKEKGIVLNFTWYTIVQA